MRIAEGAERARRDPSEIDIATAMVVSPGPDSRTGNGRVRRFAALYISLFPKLAGGTGLPEDFMSHIREIFRSKGFDQAAAAVTLV